MSAEPFLGVAKSATGRKWIAREGDARTALTLSQRLNLPEIVGRVMCSRGIALDEAESFLNPTLRNLLPDPSGFRDMEVAVARIVSAVDKGEKIVVFGDYDVDGATSSAVLLRYFAALGVRAGSYIPDRLSEGYGPNAAAMLKLRSEGADLVITVDCGTTSFEPLDAAAGAGLDVVVIDHHEAEAKLPTAIAVVNPKRVDEAGNPHTYLAAVGLVFLLCVALNRAFRDAGRFGAQHKEPNLKGLLDIVALGTVCDVVPLNGVNRAFVRQGLKVMAERNNPGINALGDVASVDEAPGTYHAGFIFGPRVNAGGRVGESNLGTRLLSTNDTTEAANIAKHLNELNAERQALEATILAQAMEQAEAAESANGSIVMVSGEGWHPGVIGIVASRLKDRYNRPACVIAFNDGIGSGSGRSINGVDLGRCVIAARQSGHLIKGGGHAMAAGFTLEQDKLLDLRAFFEERIGAQIAEKGIEPLLSMDGAIKTAGVDMDLLEALEMVGPFGAGNAEPRFVIPNARLAFADVVGSDHVRVRIRDESGGQLNGIAFRCLENGLGEVLLKHDGAPLHIAGKLRVNTWQGNSSAQMIIDDAAKAW